MQDLPDAARGDAPLRLLRHPLRPGRPVLRVPLHIRVILKHPFSLKYFK